MTFTDQQKQDVYKQINAFNNQNSNPSLDNSPPFSSAFLYVDESTAKDRAEFVRYLLAQKLITPPKKVIDLAFGSGNLTSHLLLDNNLEPEKVVFNDKNTDKTNQEIKLDIVSQVTQHNFLDSLPFNEKFDWVVFNPQIGGNYPSGDSGLGQSITIKISEKTINDYLKNELQVGFEFITQVDDTNKTITIHSDSASKSDMQAKLKDLRVWNYYDVSYQSKTGDPVIRESNVVKLRKNLDAIVNDGHCVIFLGDEKHFKVLFADYPNIYRYMAGGKDLFVASKTGEAKTICYEHNNGAFIENTECKKASSNLADLGSLDEVFEGLTQAVKEFHQHSMQNPFGGSYADSEDAQSSSAIYARVPEPPEFNKATKTQEKSVTSQPDKQHDYNFPYKNILLKGVPGTGKSRLLELIIEKRLKLQKADWDHHVLRVNIHSASSNADLMQGIAVSANDGAITYSEKRGLIFDLICRACQYPNQPFVLILEEVQENSLNELIGDLIYLIEDSKRAKLSTISQALSSNDCLGLVEAYVNNLQDVHYVKIPNLVSLGEYRKMILPANLYVFCTSNYRDDKKIIEDNLLRRFEVIDLYPRPEAIKNQSVSAFLQKLNSVIVEVLKDEIHPDRFQIGHAIWMDVKNKESFAKALYKALIELKEIREIQPADLKKIFEQLKQDFLNNNKHEFNEWLYQVLVNLTPDNPVAMIHSLQGMAYQDLMTLINNSEPEVEHSEVSE